MKKFIAALTVITMFTPILTGCSQNDDNSGQNRSSENSVVSQTDNGSESDSSAESQISETLVNDNPIKPVEDDTKYAVEYFNQHAYTSDFSYNEAQSGSCYWVYKELDELRKATLDDHMTVDNSLTITLGDGLDEVIKTDYLNYWDYNHLDKMVGTEDQIIQESLKGMTEDRQEIFTLYVKNTADKEVAVSDCVIDGFVTGNNGESCEYMGLHKGDSLDKVIETIGSPNRLVDFSSTGSKTYDIQMKYIDAQNERTALITVELYYDGMDSEDTKAVLKWIHMYNRIENREAH